MALQVLRGVIRPGSFSFVEMHTTGHQETFRARKPLGRVCVFMGLQVVLGDFGGSLASSSWPPGSLWLSLGAPLAWKQTRNCLIGFYTALSSLRVYEIMRHYEASRSLVRPYKGI